MNPDMKKRLLAIVTKSDSAWTQADLRFLRVRASYLTPEQLKRLNRIIKERGEGLKTVAKKDLQDVTFKSPIIEETADEIEAEDDSQVDQVNTDDQDDDSDPDMPEDSGELEIVDDEQGDDIDDESGDEDEIDIDSMDLEQLKGVAKDLGIKSPHLFKSADSLREKILATYETSNEAQADQADAKADDSEVV